MTEKDTDPFDIRDLLVVKLTRISSTLDRFSNYYYDEIYPETNLNDARYLMVIGASGEASAADIVRATSFDKATVSRNIKRLIAQGLICTTPDRSDARRTTLTLSEKGQQVYRTISRAIQVRDRAALDVLTPGEEMMLFELLDKLQRAADERVRAMNELGYDPAIRYEDLG